jgi:ribosome-interacting GTPase 1
MEAMCKQIHHHLTKEFKYALVWGVSAKHSPQRVGLTHQLADEDVVQVRSRGHTPLSFIPLALFIIPQHRT